MRITIHKFLVIVAVGSSAAGAKAQTYNQDYELEIERVPLTAALASFSQQSGLGISFIPNNNDESARILVGPLKGRYTVESALDQIVSGRALTYRRVNASTVSVFAQMPRSNDGANRASTERVRFAKLTPDPQVGSGSPAAASREQSPSPTRRDVEEVVVTAQRREERLQDVPISISVLGGNELDRLTAEGVTETLNRVPGVATLVGFQGGGTQLAVRGVSAGGPLFNGSSPIAYYLDSVPFGLVKTATAPDANPYDLERIEVLRGPQGTLYGASAQNGVVRLLTKDADPNEFELKARTSFSSTEEGGENYRGDMAVNVPIISEKLAVRAVVGHQELSGWVDSPVDNDVNDATLRNMRFKIGAQPTEELSLGFSAWIARNDYGAPSMSNDEGRITATQDQGISTDYDSYGLKVSYDFARFTLTSMTGYLDYATASELDAFLPTPLFTGLDARVLSEEIALNSGRDQSWLWSFGAFYRDGEDRLRQNNLGGGAPFDYTNGSESYAVFGEVGRRFANEKLEWTLGARYFHDDVFVRENVNQGLPGEPAIYKRDSYHSTTPRAVLTWYPSANVTLYGSYSEGFRSGFSQDPGVARQYPSFPSLQPDKLHNYELGGKAQSTDGGMALEMAVYFIDWEDVQQTLVVPFQGTQVTALVNGQSASGVGVDFVLTTRPLDGLELGINFGWNDLAMDSEVVSGAVLLFDSGDRLNMSPEYTAGASADLSFPLGTLEGQLSASANYISRQYQRTTLGPVLAVGSGDTMLLARTSFSINSPDSWTATFFVDNVGNEKGTPLVPPYGVPEWAVRTRPRTYGLQLDWHF